MKADLMKVNAIRIPCQNLEHSEAYYEQSLGWTKSFGSVDEGFVGFDMSGVTMILELEAPGEFESGRYLGFSLSVDDIEAYFDEAQDRGVAFTGPPEDQGWGGKMTHVADVSGNTFSLIEV